MLNQLDTIDDLMTRLDFHADQSAKRRKLLFVDPFEVDDSNDGIEKLTIFRVRKSEARPLYEENITSYYRVFECIHQFELPVV